MRARARGLGTLRRLVGLPPGADLTERQWSLLGSQLAVAEGRLLGKLQRAAREHLPKADEPTAARALASVLGEAELELARAYAFFDTYLDVLTQRHSPPLGALLRGCDVLARDALARPHPALAIIEAPLVYCDRGFGASVLREGVRLTDGSPNPMPLIQIPYSRLQGEKHHVTSILHESGHEAMVRLGLVASMPRAMRAAMERAGAPHVLRDLAGLWCSEIGPDLWSFCLSGLAQTASVREILALPPEHVFRLSWLDPHPPPYLRVLFSIAWCRELWGRGPWDEWEREWDLLYPLSAAPPSFRPVLEAARLRIPTLTQALFRTRYRALSGRTLPELFDLEPLRPERLARRAGARPDLAGLSPSAQLAVFHLLRIRRTVGAEELDRLMTRWLAGLPGAAVVPLSRSRPGELENVEPSSHHVHVAPRSRA